MSTMQFLNTELVWNCVALKTLRQNLVRGGKWYEDLRNSSLWKQDVDIFLETQPSFHLSSTVSADLSIFEIRVSSQITKTKKPQNCETWLTNYSRHLQERSVCRKKPDWSLDSLTPTMKIYTQAISFEDAEHERRQRDFNQRKAEKRAQRTAEQKRHRAEEAAARRAVQNKRDQWKVASARYYERHPEVKEKKRLKAAEKRAAKRLARRQWDPPSVGERRRREQQLGDFEHPENLDIDIDPDLEHHRVYLTHDDVLELFQESMMDAPTADGSDRHSYRKFPSEISGAAAMSSARADAAESLLEFRAQPAVESDLR
ncbi:hypothetical protein B0H14DRAFT_2594773 [Mycena olivaceomarginata]|nr:hypothetical protein B0H14DRAFT_2594773 [Mycena olivaceomarginata]